MKGYTIFINEHPIYLTDELLEQSNKNFFRLDKTDLISLVNQMENSEIENAYLYHKEIKKGWKTFKKQFKVIKAAGGVVKNLRGDVLCIYRNEKWDLPKGKLEKKEKLETAALREVEEECGIDLLELGERLLKTYHIYKLKEKYVLKITHWFSMFSNYDGLLSPQLEEGITKVEWVPNEKMDKVLEDTYANIKLLLK